MFWAGTDVNSSLQIPFTTYSSNVFVSLVLKVSFGGVRKQPQVWIMAPHRKPDNAKHSQTMPWGYLAVLVLMFLYAL